MEWGGAGPCRVNLALQIRPECCLISRCLPHSSASSARVIRMPGCSDVEPFYARLQLNPT
eukprot:359985-Chlamydomonas_euryale.AAC.7